MNPLLGGWPGYWLLRTLCKRPSMVSRHDGPPEGLESCPDPRVRQFVHGEAGERLREISLGRA